MRLKIEAVRLGRSARERPTLAALLTCIALVGALATAGAGTAAAAPRDFFGVASQSPLGSEDFRRMSKARVGTLLVNFSWGQVQQVRGPCTGGPPGLLNECNFAVFDPLVGRAAAAGVKPFARLNGSAPFVSGGRQTPPIATDADRKGWKGFVKAAASRYGPGGQFWRSGAYRAYGGSRPMPITHWQIWNEPSSPDHFEPRAAPRKYADLVKISEPAIKSAQPRAEVVLAGMFARAGRSKGGMGLARFLRGFYRVKGIERFFDAGGLHPYARKLRGVKRQIKTVRKAMKKGGARRKDLWLTEIGWASGGPRKNQAVLKSPGAQAKMLRKSFRFLKKRRRRLNIGGLHWFSWRDISKRSPNACNFCPKTGLLKRSGKPKPAYRAFKKFT